MRLYAGNELVKAKRSFPFQFRFWPTAAQVGSTLTLRAEAEDKAGNVRTITRDVRVVSAQALVQSPLPVGAKPVLTGSPDGRLDADRDRVRVHQQPDLHALRVAA